MILLFRKITSMNIEYILDKLHSNINMAKTPEEISKYIENAKQDIQNYLNKSNLDMFSDIIEQMTPIPLDDDVS